MGQRGQQCGVTAHPPLPAAASRIKDAQRLQAAMRLVSAAPGDKRDAAKRFLAGAATHGIDPSLMWVTADDLGNVREVCLPVLGSGRTATLFLAPPQAGVSSAEQAVRRTERRDVVLAACHSLAGIGNVALAQSLPAPDEHWAVAAFSDANFQRIGNLAYLHRPMDPPTRRAPEPSWPPGIELRSIASMGSSWRSVLEATLDATYIDTLDCPGLCGLRATPDVLDSHLASGRWDPRYWWLVFDDSKPAGCVLFNHAPLQRAVELVYLGLAPSARGRGLGRSLLTYGLSAIRGLDADEVTCAVDRANAPAMRLYQRSGFTEFASRIAMVRPVEQPVDE